MLVLLRQICSLLSCPQISDALVNGSNYYSPPEMLLLTWMTLNLQQAFPGNHTVVRSF